MDARQVCVHGDDLFWFGGKADSVNDPCAHTKRANVHVFPAFCQGCSVFLWQCVCDPRSANMDLARFLHYPLP